MQILKVPADASKGALVGNPGERGGQLKVEARGAPAAPVAPAAAPAKAAAVAAPPRVDAAKDWLTQPLDAADAGSAELRRLRGIRNPFINSATQSALSNCALDTMAAMLAGKSSSGDVSKRWQEENRRPVDIQLQSEKTWAAAMIPTATADRKDWEALTERILRLQEAKEYCYGDAQFNAMQKLLLDEADTRGKDKKPHQVAKCKAPDKTMLLVGDLKAEMRKLPKGTQFAVFLYAPDAKEIKQHWVYAENFAGKLVFEDYQVNKQSPHRLPPSAFLDDIPPVPKEESREVDKRAKFVKGSFLALIPQPTETKVNLPLELINRQAVNTELVSIRDRLNKLRKMIEGRPLLSTYWPSLGQRPLLEEIPDPEVLDKKVRDLAQQLGTAARAVGDDKHTPLSLKDPGVIKIIGESKVSEERKTLSFELRNAKTKVRTPGIGSSTAKLDPTKLPREEGFLAGDTEYPPIFSVAYDISAQRNGNTLQVNALNSNFGDLIHESIHFYQPGSLPVHISEGMTELFAALIAEECRTTANDNTFKYIYNPAYYELTYDAFKLKDLLGLRTLAKLQFGKDAESVVLKARLPVAHAKDAEKIWGQLKEKDSAQAGLGSLATAMKDAAPDAEEERSAGAATALGKTYTAVVKLYQDQVAVRKAAAMERNELYVLDDGKRVDLKPNDPADQRKIVARLGTLHVVDEAEKKLKILMKQEPETSGIFWGGLREQLDTCEKVVKDAIDKPHLHFKVTGVPDGKVVMVGGTLPELGGPQDPNFSNGATAKAMEAKGLGTFELAVGIADGFGKKFKYRYFVKDAEAPKAGGAVAITRLGTQRALDIVIGHYRQTDFGGAYGDLAK